MKHAYAIARLTADLNNKVNWLRMAPKFREAEDPVAYSYRRKKIEELKAAIEILKAAE